MFQLRHQIKKWLDFDFYAVFYVCFSWSWSCLPSNCRALRSINLMPQTAFLSARIRWQWPGKQRRCIKCKAHKIAIIKLFNSESENFRPYAAHSHICTYRGIVSRHCLWVVGREREREVYAETRADRRCQIVEVIKWEIMIMQARPASTHSCDCQADTL